MVEAALYLEVDLLSIFLLCVMIAGQRRFAAGMESQQLFYRMAFALAAILIIDMAARTVDGRVFFTGRFWNNLFEAAYFSMTGYLCLQWFSYINGLVYGSAVPRWIRQLRVLPCAVLIGMAALSPWTHWIFSVDEKNVYHRETLGFAAQLLIAWGYLLTSSLLMLRKARGERLRARRMDDYMLASFALYPTLGSIVQTLVYGVTMVWPASACALLVIFMSQQNRRIASDALTGLNNRGQMDRFLETELSNTTRDSPLFMILIDVDHFKRINDTLGHAEGDLALIRVADVLKRAVALGYAGDFLARYGGDEFTILCRRRYGEEVDQVVQAIEHALLEENAHRAAGRPELALSMGYACVPRGGTPEELIRLADARMYEVKRVRHARENTDKTNAPVRSGGAARV